MPRNGNGTYIPAPSSWNPAINGNAATAPDWNSLLNDLSNAITQSVSRDGQSPMTSNLSMGGNRIINVGQAVDDDDALRRAQVIKGQDLASASNLGIPIEGSLFDVTGTTTINTFSDVYPGRVVMLRFMGAMTLTNSSSLRLPEGSDILTAPGHVGLFVNVQFGQWSCVAFQKFSPPNHTIWTSQPIGSPFPLWGHLTGVTEPPNNNPDYRYIKLTASDPYNAGVLINQSVTGTAPNVVATAQISLAGSPMNGATVVLLNTERTFIRPGNSGVRQSWLIESHTHSGTTESAGAHSHPVGNARGEGVGPISNAQGSEPVERITSTGSAGAHAHGFTTLATGGEETRPRNIGATYYMRIM